MTKPRRSLTRLPSLPTIAAEILRVFGDPDAPIQMVADLVQADPAIASKLLKAANSSRFGLRREVADVRQAIVLLGKAKVTPLVLSFSLSTELRESKEFTTHFKHFWLRSFVQASAGEVLGTLYGANVGAECFTTNLLASIGQLGLLNQDTEKYIDCIEQSQQNGQSLAEIEREVYGATHHEISAEMLEHSGLPQRCIDAIHSLLPDAVDRELNAETQRLASITEISDAFARYLCDKDTGVALIVLRERMAAFDSETIDVEQLTTAVRAKLDESASLFDIDPSLLPDPDDLLEEALDQLAEFTEMMQGASDTIPTELVAENGRLKMQVEDLVRQTGTDALTGIANRAFFDRRLTEMVQHCRQNCLQMAVAVVDIDHFKKVNDAYGHQAGDHILRQVAGSLNGITRDGETLARYGGEEFAILLEDVAADNMTVIGERFRSAIEQLDITYAGTRIGITVSVGLCCGFPDDSEYGLKLFSRADAAMYQAKQNGRNVVVVDSSFSDASAGGATNSPQSEPTPAS